MFDTHLKVPGSDEAFDTVAVQSSLLAHMSEIVGSTRSDYIVGCNQASRANNTLLQVDIEICQITSLVMVQEKHVDVLERAFSLHFGNGICGRFVDNGDGLFETSERDDLGHTVCTSLVHLHAPHVGVSIVLAHDVGSEQRRIGKISTQLDKCLWLSLANLISKHFGFLKPNADQKIVMIAKLVCQLEQLFYRYWFSFVRSTILDKG